MTEEQAIALYDSKFWETMSYKERAMFQMWEERLCMPFDIFQEAVEKALGRPVFTHELALNAEGIKKELLGEKAPPSPAEVLALIPKEKQVVLVRSPCCHLSAGFKEGDQNDEN